ncbi:band 4.1-like protein 4 isoform X1 [Argiope bruennichi]|uniref:Erythrocyte membrane protein band 4.1-like 4A n=1 Tax=Argiope bruennichi TaxID=94029 RepID=A0A8T0DYH8_ARGBR|nr:band 4.1-like protein 4 isoform X1 [Argiope bruennichi]KAF8763316.1 Band 4.1-like protein 4 like protein [Argiope bruennichi]
MFWCFGKKAQNYHCKIVLLDETDFIQDIQESSRGQQLLDVVFKHLNLMETAYFGLRFVDATGQRHWLDPNKNIVKQMKGLETFTFYFGVKFYASDPCKLLEEITRYQFFLQVKQDIYQGRLPLTYDLAAELFAYAIQSELGDYDPRRHLPGYASEFNFVPNQTKDLESKAMEIHKGLCGTVPAVAEINFLDRIKWLDMYGIDLHPVLGEDSIEYYLGLTPSGILVLRNKTKVGNYFWPRITKVYYKRKYFMIRAKDKSNEQNTYGFELPSKRACKHLWKCCVEHRAFFKLTQIREVPGQCGKIVGLENKFYGSRLDKNSQSLNMKARLRTPPTFVRVPSRRFHKRIGQPDGADAGPQSKEETIKHMLEPSVVMTPIPQNPILIPALHRSTSVPSVVPSPYKVAPWEDPRLNSRGMYSSCANPSPRSIRSAGALPSRRYPLHGRTGSIESTNSYDYRKRKHHHSRRQSDNESEVSKSSKCSKSSRSSRHRRHGSQSGGDGSDSEPQHRHKRHSRRKKHGSTYELVDSEGQWKEVQRQQQERQQEQARMQNAVVRDLSKRKSGYMNSGLETESESNYSHRRRHRRHRSRSPDSKAVLPHEVRKYIDYNLIDPSTLTEEEKRDIKYTKIQADSRLFKIRYSSSQGQLSKNLASRNSTNSLHKSQLADDPGPPPPYTSDHPTSYLSPNQQRLVDIEEKNENILEPVQIPKIGSHNGNHKTPSFKDRFAQNNSNQQLLKHSQSQDWGMNKPIPSINKSQLSESNGKEASEEENSHSGYMAKNIRLVNGHFYPTAQKSLITMPTMTHRVTFENDDTPKQYPKNLPSSQSWVQCPPRENGEVPKSKDAAPNNHEMSTEL